MADARRQRVVVIVLLLVVIAIAAFSWEEVYRMLAPEGRFVGSWKYRPDGTVVRFPPDEYAWRGWKWRYRGVVPFLVAVHSGEAAVKAEYTYRVGGDIVTYTNEASGVEVERRFEFVDADEVLIDGELRFMRVHTR